MLNGIDLGGKLAIVTGGYSGLGLERTRALATAGAQVVVPARRPAVAAEALKGLDGVEADELDLGDMDSVKTFADRFLTSGRSVDIMIDSAAVMACPETRTGPGWEARFATSHLGHFALVNRLWSAVASGARIVSVSSAGHRSSGVRRDDVRFETGYEKWKAYGQAKTANALFAVRLDEEGNVINSSFETPEQGAATQVWAATSERPADAGGVHCEDCDIAEKADGEAFNGGVRSCATDPGQAARLWRLPAGLTGVDAFAKSA